MKIFNVLNDRDARELVTLLPETFPRTDDAVFVPDYINGFKGHPVKISKRGFYNLENGECGSYFATLCILAEQYPLSPLADLYRFTLRLLSEEAGPPVEVFNKFEDTFGNA